MRHTVYISVGSNLGDKHANCQFGINSLAVTDGIRLVKQSPFYRTEPVGYEDQDWFINGVFCIETDLTPVELLKQMQSVQDRAGRKKSMVRNGPRTLDLDILMFDDQVVDTDTLLIPHPRMHERRFVLQPFCDISPDMIHPVLKKDMKTLLMQLPDNAQKVARLI